MLSLKRAPWQMSGSSDHASLKSGDRLVLTKLFAFTYLKHRKYIFDLRQTVLEVFTNNPFLNPGRPQRDPPEITLRPRNQAVKAGGITSFYCIARGDPIPVIQWRKNGKRVSGTQSRYMVQEFPPGGSLLRIEPVRHARDDAVYECVAENGVGDAVSAEASLTVYEEHSSISSSPPPSPPSPPPYWRPPPLTFPFPS
ncbi:hypothetical protein M8J77_020783 [Diaphorina citri]|nr:hypothetical protein M8J77_020783 [Diaphorina citri]